MNFLRKLIRVTNNYGEAISLKAEVEREPTIAEDYSEKWKEIRWRSQILGVLTWIWLIIFLSFVSFALYGNFVLQISKEQRVGALNVIAPTVVIFLAGSICLRWFRCPRCQRTFQDPIRRDVYHVTTRCQYCDLKMGAAPKSDSLR